MARTYKKNNRFALISVSDKQGIIEFAQTLTEVGFSILSTGGTCKLLKQNNIHATEISEYTQFPEIMDGRLKTLHPKVHGAILYRKDQDETLLDEHGMLSIDIVIVNLYPFEQTVANPEATLADAIENIDIGGPTMLRAAAKNYQRVGVVVDPHDYIKIANILRAQNELPPEIRFTLAQKAFAHTANYDGNIANYLGSFNEQEEHQSLYPKWLTLQFQKKRELRYGENPHQTASLYYSGQNCHGLAGTTPLQGKELSYNNLVDIEAGWRAVNQLAPCSCVIIKHTNPCGAATSDNALDAYQKAYASDPISAFGGIIAFNCQIDETVAQDMLKKQFVEAVIAPSIDNAARALFTSKPNIRLLICSSLSGSPNATGGVEFKKINGGILIQDLDAKIDCESCFSVVTTKKPSSTEMQDAIFGWRIVKHVKSNAIVFCQNLQLLGVGAGQMSRIFAIEVGRMHAQSTQHNLAGSVMASDAFFPFADAIAKASTLKITTIIQPGGSVKDKEVIAAANDANIAMIFTNVRHFSH